MTIPGPAVPGSLLTGTLLNTTPNFGSTNVLALALLSSDGDRIAPEDFASSDVTYGLPPGASLSLSVPVPAAGPGSSGSVVAYAPQLGGAVARVDIGSPTPGFPAIHAFYGVGDHAYAATTWFATAWNLANTSPATFTFAAGDALNVYTPGGTVPVASVSLQGNVIGPGGVIGIPLPLVGFPAQPYTVEVAWVDPIAGPRSLRHGIRPEGQPADLFLPGGHTVPVGGSLPTRIRCTALQQPPNPLAPPQYLLLAGVAPGLTPLPSSAILGIPQTLPIAADPISIAAASGTLAAFLPGGIGFLTLTALPCFGCPQYGPLPANFTFQTTAPSVVHPSIPGVSGLGLRLAALLFDPTSSTWTATQAEEVVLQ